MHGSSTNSGDRYEKRSSLRARRLADLLSDYFGDREKALSFMRSFAGTTLVLPTLGQVRRYLRKDAP